MTLFHVFAPTRQKNRIWAGGCMLIVITLRSLFPTPPIVIVHSLAMGLTLWP